MEKYLGLSHEYGTIDCIKLIQFFYENELGISLDIPNYSFSRMWIRDYSPLALESKLLKYAIKVPLTEAKNYDLIVFKSADNKFITHFGMFLQPCKMLHVEENNTSKIEYLSDYWINLTYGIYRHKALV